MTDNREGDAAQLTWSQFYSSGKACLKRPRPTDVAHGVATATDHQQRLVERLDELHTVRVSWDASIGQRRWLRISRERLTSHRNIETAELITRQRVSATLEHDSAGIICLHDLPDHLEGLGGQSRIGNMVRRY